MQDSNKIITKVNNLSNSALPALHTACRHQRDHLQRRQLNTPKCLQAASTCVCLHHFAMAPSGICGFPPGLASATGNPVTACTHRREVSNLARLCTGKHFIDCSRVNWNTEWLKRLYTSKVNQTTGKTHQGRCDRKTSNCRAVAQCSLHTRKARVRFPPD